MDWSKAKSVLIFIFFSLNIFLLYQLIVGNPANIISRDNIRNTIIFLKNREITLKCDIPVYNSENVSLDFEGLDLPKEKIKQRIFGKETAGRELVNGTEVFSSGSKKITFINNESFVYKNESPSEALKSFDNVYLEKYMKKFLADMDLPASEYEIDGKCDENKADGTIEITLIERYKGFLIYENRVYAKISSKGILNLDYKRIKSFMVRKKKVIPAYQILLKKYNNRSRVTITSIDIGFINKSVDMDIADQYPVWRICEDQGIQKFYDSYTGEEIITH